MTGRLVFEWIAFFLIFIFGIYTMFVIKNEKKNYLKEGISIEFKIFKMLIPKWWGIVPTESPNELCFKRLDTQYEWVAHFYWIEVPSDKNIVELFKEKITDRKILFDEDTSVIYNPSDFQSGSLIDSKKFEIVRLEGTATLDKSERLYYDAYLIRHIPDGKYLYAESKSSVLNGLVEGPYFEEVMARLELL